MIGLFSILSSFLFTFSYHLPFTIFSEAPVPYLSLYRDLISL